MEECMSKDHPKGKVCKKEGTCPVRWTGAFSCCAGSDVIVSLGIAQQWGKLQLSRLLN
jgi:hypothetical protein